MSSMQRALQDGHESGDEAINGGRHTRSWDFVAVDEAPNDDTRPNNAPAMSLFSPGVPAMTSLDGTANSDTDSTRPALGSTSPLASRPLSVLAGASTMARRSARLTVSDEQPAMVQMNSQIPSAQKAVDDPTTPVDNQSNETRARDYTTANAIGRLFVGDATMPSSRTPSYTQATGPLYLRGMSMSGARKCMAG